MKAGGCAVNVRVRLLTTCVAAIGDPDVGGTHAQHAWRHDRPLRPHGARGALDGCVRVVVVIVGHVLMAAANPTTREALRCIVAGETSTAPGRSDTMAAGSPSTTA